jgi:hypothetical protein
MCIELKIRRSRLPHLLFIFTVAYRDVLTGMIIPVDLSLMSSSKFKNKCLNTHMDNLIEKIEKTLGIKIENVEEVKRSFPLFDLIKMDGIKLSLIKNPLFLVIEDEDVYEKRIEGNFIVIETDRGYLLAKYSGEPNIELLRNAKETEELEETDKETAHEQEAEEVNQIEEEKEVGEENYEEQRDEEESDPVKEIVEKLPVWADGAVVVKKDRSIVAMPIKKSTKKEGAYYASTTWKPLDVQPSENMVNHIITKNGKTIRVNVYHGDRYINIFIRSSRGHYSRRR